MKSRAQRYRYVRHVVSGTRPSPWSPLSLGSSLAAWYKADAGCYTDAACLFASASSQYLSKTSPTFAPTTKMTIRTWVKISSFGGAYHGIAGRWGGGQNQFRVYLDPSGYINVETDASTGNTADALTAGVAYEVVVVYDGALSASNRIAVYINGVSSVFTPVGTIPTALASSTAALVIGATEAASNPINGAIARLGFSSQALSGAALTAAHTSTFWADMTSARQADWFSFYNLCEASSTRVDSTGLNNLTPTNGPTVAAGPGEGLCVNNAPRKRIADQSGNARHRTQATIGKQPLYLDAIQNGRAVGRFDGTDDFDQILSNLGSLPITIFGAVKSPNSGVAAVWDGGSLAARLGLLRINTDQVAFCGSSVAAAHTAGAFHVYETAFDSAASTTLTIDGVDVATGDSGDPDGSVGFTVGAVPDGTAPSAMDDGEVFIVVGAMTAAQKSSARAYLRARWNTP